MLTKRCCPGHEHRRRNPCPNSPVDAPPTQHQRVMSAPPRKPDPVPARTKPFIEDDRGAITPIGAWRAVRRHWATAALTMLAVMLGTAFYTLGQTPIYEAKATI